MPVAEPHKEIRFTRANQAIPFWIGAALCAAITILLLTIATHRDTNPALPHPLWAFIPLATGFLLTRVAVHCTRHAYLIFSPIGIEIFPLIRPAKNMNIIPWAQIDSFEMSTHLLTLHFDAEQSGGIHLSLSPIRKNQRTLLARALEGRLDSPSS